MKQGFLEREAKQGNKKSRTRLIMVLLFGIGLFAFIVFFLKDTLDLSDPTSRQLLMYSFLLVIFLFISILIGLIKSILVAVNGNNLALPFKDKTKEEAGKIINQEIADGKIQVEKYIHDFSDGKTPHGERVILIPSYLLLCNGMGRVIAIPRDKIYWLCAQVGRKGSSSFIVRLQIFTENKIFYMEGVEPEYVEGIAAKIYQYIPNIFSEYDPFFLSYELEKIYNKNRGEFLKIYEDAREKMNTK